MTAGLIYPFELNYSMLAEWVKHSRTFIAWPVKDSMVYPEDYERVSEGYTEIIKAVAEFETVTVVVNPDDLSRVKRLFTENNIDFLSIAHNDAWLRDNGPTFIVNGQGEVAGINWGFNAWGGKYSPWDLDDQVAPQILNNGGLRRFDAPFVMEGGSIHVDGEGTLITTEECLLNPNRNPDLTKSDIEGYLKKFLNVDKVIWLKNGLSGDETDGHVDNIACFAAPGKVIVQVCNDPEDENFVISQEILAVLKNAVDAKGRLLEIVEIQQAPMATYKEKRLTLSYLNFYFVNGGIILPVFGGAAVETDLSAIKVLSEAFPNRRIRTVNGMAIIREGGNVHCMTQQMPAAQ